MVVGLAGQFRRAGDARPFTGKPVLHEQARLFVFPQPKFVLSQFPESRYSDCAQRFSVDN
jgi:hypothetical protein